MKALRLIFILLISSSILNSCSSPEKKFKKAIKEELNLTLHDFKSYEPVQYSKIEIATSDYADLPIVKDYLNMSETYLKLVDEYKEKQEIYDYDFSRDRYYQYSNARSEALRTARKYLDKIDSVKMHFVPENIGWKMKHTFRAKNLGGNFGLHHYEFYVNKEYTKIIKTIDLDEELE